MSETIRILLSAAEASSCLHASHLIPELRAEAKELGLELELFGAGDARMRGLGFDAVVEASSLQAMGTTEVLGRLPRILEAGKTLERESRARKPAVAVLMDYPDFHFKLAARLKTQGVRCISYIPPKVWIWRRARLKRMKELFARVLCIFPFEEKLYRDAGIPADYVGNPLADELPLGLTQAQAREALFGEEQIRPSDRVVAVLPGSRPGELSRHVPVVVGAVDRAALDLKDRLGAESRLHVLIPFADAEQGQRWKSMFVPGGETVRYHFHIGRSAECMVAADAGLIKSGTSTLEAGVLGLPHAVFYRASGMTAWVFRNFIQKKGLFRRGKSYIGPVGLVNLFTGWNPGDALRAPEFLLDQATAENLGRALVGLLFDSEERSRQMRVLGDLRREVLGNHDREGTLRPSRRAAQRILEIALDTTARGSK